MAFAGGPFKLTVGGGHNCPFELGLFWVRFGFVLGSFGFVFGEAGEAKIIVNPFDIER